MTAISPRLLAWAMTSPLEIFKEGELHFMGHRYKLGFPMDSKNKSQGLTRLPVPWRLKIGTEKYSIIVTAHCYTISQVQKKSSTEDAR